MFFPSPRNTGEALESMFDEAAVSIIITAAEPAPVVSSAISRRQMQHVLLLSQDEILDRTPVIRRPFVGDFNGLRFQPWVILHTSGSTGLPKIVTLKHGFAAAIDAFQTLSVNPMSLYQKLRMLIPFPPFHLAGIIHSLTSVVWADSTAVLPPPGIPITADVVYQMHVHARIEYSMLAPSLLTDLVKTEAGAQTLDQLHGVSFSGGPLPEHVAKIASRHTTLHSTIGATEYGGVPQLPKDPEDFNYFRFNEEMGGIALRESEMNGMYEMVFYRHEPAERMQAIFVTFPELDEYHTKDCFSKHPTKHGLWKYESRLDDVIVLSNGEKINPLPMEGSLSSCPAITGCLVVGQGQFQCALLVEPKDPDRSRIELTQALQPFVDNANRTCPKYARLALDHIILTSSKKPLPRAAKGTIQRAKANALYESEITRLYENVEKVEETSEQHEINFSSYKTTERSLLRYIISQVDAQEHEVRVTDDFFARGMDSLQVIAMARVINKGRKGTFQPVSPAVIYQYPTVEKLAAALSSGVQVREYSDFEDDDEFDKQTWQSMEDLYQELRGGLLHKHGSQPCSFWTVLIGLLRSSNPPPLYQPDGGRLAWLQVLGSFLINLNNWGLVNSFGVFQAFYEANYLRSSSPSRIAWIGTVQGALLLLVGSVSGPLFDKGFFGCILLVGSAGVVLGLMMLSLATEYYQIMLSQGILMGVCLGLLYIPSVALIPLYFKARRGLALGLATAGGSFGGVIYPVVFKSLLSSLGFGWTTRVAGFIALCTLVAASILIQSVGARSTRQFVDRTAFTDLPYMSYMVSGVLLFAGVLVPYFLASTYAHDVLLAEVDFSFYLLAILNAAQFLGRVLPAILSDWIGPEILLGAGTLTAGVLGFCWIAVDSITGYIAWLVFYGLASGAVVTLPAIVLPYICPSMATIGTRLGMVYGAAGIGFLISSPAALELNASTHGFLGSQLWVGACCCTALAFYVVSFVEAFQRRRTYERSGLHRRPYLLRKPQQRLLNRADIEKGLYNRSEKREKRT